MGGGGDDLYCWCSGDELVERGTERTGGEAVEGGGEFVEDDGGVWDCYCEESCLFSCGEGMLWEGPEFGFGEAYGTEEGEGLAEGLIEEVDDGE